MTQQTRLSKTIDMALLADFYGPLLTEKQQEVLRLFYEEDFSLGEIAEQCDCSRQAVHDLLKRSEALLTEYEHKLGLAARHRERQRLLATAEGELRELKLSAGFWRIWQELGE